MDIESLVERITREVLKEVGQAGSSDDRMPPRRTRTSDGKTCLLATTGECGGVGCCAEYSWAFSLFQENVPRPQPGSGGPRRARTDDPRIKSPLLYQLS